MSDWWQTAIGSPTGARLNSFAIAPDGPARAIIQINHGMAEHAGRYEQFARCLAAHGYAVIAHDHRGHGLTEAPDVSRGQFARKNGLGLLIDDIHAVNRYVAGRFPGTPILCFGHSMGAILAMNYALRHGKNIAGAAIWSTAIEWNAFTLAGSLLLKIERMLKGSDVPSLIAPKLTFEAWNRRFAPNRTAFDWLSGDTVEVDRFINDPLCGIPLSVGAWLSVLQAMRSGASRSALAGLANTLPFNLVAGSSDPVSDGGRNMLHLAKQLQSAGLTDISARIYPLARHECLHEIIRDRVMSDFVSWLDTHF